MRSLQSLLAVPCWRLIGFLLLSTSPSATGFSPATFHHQKSSLPTQQQLQRVLSKPTGIAGSTALSPLLHNIGNNDSNLQQLRRLPLVRFVRRNANRLDTISFAGLDPNTVQAQGLFGRIKQVHNPITYIVLALLAGFKWDWCFKSPYYWFAVAFCVKWYRARYVFKIPVWDRQPNWNNVITSKEQEKDLKAYTCKKCGSTIFIAKTREFFFEGNTGIGGLGCFSCGAKGKDNFVMDRDRIVEDVADTDDYFEYERPLDFVTAAERRKVLKEAGGDEAKANQLLVERVNQEAGVANAPTTAKQHEGANILDAEIVDENATAEAETVNTDEKLEDNEEEPAAAEETVVDAVVEEKVEVPAEVDEEKADVVPPKEPEIEKEVVAESKIADPPKPVVASKPKPSSGKTSSTSETKISYLEKDDLDVLGLDDF